MVKPLYALASRALMSHKEMQTCLLRIQDGFIPQRSINSVQRLMEEMQETLKEMEHVLKHKQTNPNPTQDYQVPLK